MKGITLRHSRMNTVEYFHSFPFQNFQISRMHITLLLLYNTFFNFYYVILIIKKNFNKGLILKLIA